MAQRSGSIDIGDLEDIYTPVGERLRGIYKRSFAYVTIKDRLPVILTKVIDTLSRNKESIVEQHGQEAVEEIKQIVGSISKLKNEMVTNKVLTPLSVNQNIGDDDIAVWDKYLDEKTNDEGSPPTWFNTEWLYCECYMYRRLAQLFTSTKTLKTYDSFEDQKKNNFINSLNSIFNLSEYLTNLIDKMERTEVERRQDFMDLVELNLWGNRCDLSLSAGAESTQSGNPVEHLKSYKDDILVNDAEFVWNLLNKSKSNNSNIIDIVLDNAGYELFTDLCLATFLTTTGLAQRIRFYVKRYPWYVSDVTTKDFLWTVEYMMSAANSSLQTLGKRCFKYLNDKIWSIEEESYWTQPREFVDMKKYDPKLYQKLSEAKLIIFKGDLNYRKLLSDINYEYSTKFVQALRDFRPSEILSLRTVKSDVCVGLTFGKGEQLFEKDKNWMTTGQYGLIQATID